MCTKINTQRQWKPMTVQMCAEISTMKTIYAHATVLEDSPRNGVRENDSLLSTHYELSPEPFNPPSGFTPTPPENFPINILASLACTLKNSDSGRVGFKQFC